MVRNEATHSYEDLSAAGRINMREDASEEMVLLRLVEEVGPEALRVENVLKCGQIKRRVRFGGRTNIGISLQMPPVRSSTASLAFPPLKEA